MIRISTIGTVAVDDDESVNDAIDTNSPELGEPSENGHLVQVAVDDAIDSDVTGSDADDPVDSAFDAAVTAAKDAFVEWANRVSELQAELKDAKAAMKEAHEYLIDLERGGIERYRQQREQQQRWQGQTGQGQSQAGIDGESASGESMADRANEDYAAWAATPIEDLPGISAGIVKILRESNGIATLGGLAEWTNAGKKLMDLRKLGPKKAEALEEAWMGFCEGRGGQQ